MVFKMLSFRLKANQEIRSTGNEYASETTIAIMHTRTSWRVGTQHNLSEEPVVPSMLVKLKEKKKKDIPLHLTHLLPSAIPVSLEVYQMAEVSVLNSTLLSTQV